MIAVKLQGGLGNQFFQYAVGRALQLESQQELFFDLSEMGTKAPNAGTSRSFELSLFKMKAEALSPEKIETAFPRRNNSLSRQWNRLIQGKLPTHYWLEKDFTYRPPRPLSFPLYVEGYFQSYRYFESVWPQIKEEFQPRQTNDNFKKWSEQISKKTSVSLHVRRGDYVSHSLTESFHGTCSPSYYSAALETLREKIGSFEVFVFSDDLRWAQEQIVFKEPVHFIGDFQGSQSYLDLCLMQKCEHQIIANSTFSWWGAWLNSNPAKQVIAPKNWFKNPQIRTSDLVPSDWTRI